ncbi:hypothetical protein EPJ70_11950 [Brachyspira aalborgi]|uniref:Uncharacterized protein n=1 Tax=Brachyspira aalborgi TaxID=29522 RepID=A0A5C8EXW4_9SPIR|nr:hypothetical protein [Brachyspira aalborgi]TXJ42656.1 hypothetical protein EPJ70_11950 [Brachyspira aalborgi]
MAIPYLKKVIYENTKEIIYKREYIFYMPNSYNIFGNVEISLLKIDINKIHEFSNIFELNNIINTEKYTALIETLVGFIYDLPKNGLYETVKILIDRGADIKIKDEDGKTALDYAKEKELKDIEELLINSLNK